MNGHPARSALVVEEDNTSRRVLAELLDDEGSR